MFISDNLYRLVKFSELGSMTAAANELNISLSGLSRSLQKLQDDLGITIYLQENNRLELNSSGILLAESARKLIAMEKSMLENVRSQSKAIKEVRIGYSSEPIGFTLKQDLQHFDDSFRFTAEFEEEHTLFSKLTENKIDIIILPLEPKEKELTSFFYAEDTLKLLCPNHSCFSGRESVSLEELNDSVFLISSRNDSWFHLLRSLLPDAKMIDHPFQNDYLQLLDHSDLLAFSSSLSEAQYIHMVNERSLIPINDKRLSHSYFLTARKDAPPYVMDVIHTLFLLHRYDY